MTKEEINFVTEWVGKTLNTPASEAASLLFTVKEDGSGDLKSDALQVILNKDAERVKVFKDNETKAHDKGFNKAKSEALSKFETDLREKFGIKSEKQGLDLIEEVVAERMKSQGGELDEQKIKRSPEYLSMVEKLTKEKEEAIVAEATKLKDLETRIQKETTFKTVSQRISDVLKELNPILPEGKTTEGKLKAEIQMERFMRELGSEYEFEIKEGKVLVIKDGKLVENAQGYAVDFKDIVKTRASELWDFKQGEPRSGTGNNNDGNSGGAGGKGYSGPRPRNAEEYSKMISEAKTLEEKQGIMQVWEEGQK